MYYSNIMYVLETGIGFNFHAAVNTEQIANFLYTLLYLVLLKSKKQFSVMQHYLCFYLLYRKNIN